MIYQRRVDDLLRIATGGSGVLLPGAIHPDLVARLAQEASRSASHVLEICIRALDYCPPVDITFSDYLRALITADADLVGVDKYGYRVAFLEAFGARGIYPDEVRTLSVESLRWSSPQKQPREIGKFFRDPHKYLDSTKFGLKRLNFDWTRNENRHGAYKASKLNAAMLHEWLVDPANFPPEMAETFGLNRRERGHPTTAEFRFDRTGRPTFEVHSVRPAYRVAPDADIKTDVIAVITQRRRVAVNPDDPPDPTEPDDPDKTFWFRGGCTLIIDPTNDEEPIRYAIRKDVMNGTRLARQRTFLNESQGMSLRALYFGGDSGTEHKEPFALLHVGQ
jgi:hypothetical protein